MEQFVLNLIGSSVSVAVIIILLKLCSRWLDNNLRLQWKKYLYLLLAIRLLIPVNIGIPVLYGTHSTEEVQTGITQTGAAADKRITVVPLQREIPADDSLTNGKTRPVALYAPIRIWIDQTQKSTPIQWLFYIWFAGFAIGLVKLAIEAGCYRRRLLRGAQAEDDACVLAWVAQISSELHISKTFRVMQTPANVSPMVFGVARPVLLLPKTQQKNEELYYILKHELIHLKRNDIMYKYVLLLAKTLHWFNPFAHLLAKDAAICLELYCDEGVVAGGDLGQKKQYVEAIIGALEYGSRNAKFSTEFYGEKETMKKRFQNILKENHRKRGAGMVSLILAVTVLCGMLMACTIQTLPEENVKTPSADTNADNMSQVNVKEPVEQDTRTTSGGFSDEELVEMSKAYYAAKHDGFVPPVVEVDGTSADGLIVIHLYENLDDHSATYDWYAVDRVTAKGYNTNFEDIDLLDPSAEPKAADAQNPQEEAEFSDAAKEVQAIAENFTAAYFNGDITTIKTYLTDPYAWSIDAYEGTEKVTVETMKGLGDIPDDTIGGVFTVSAEFKNPEYPDSYQYLTMEFVKENDGWKIQFYGIEG